MKYYLWKDIVEYNFFVALVIISTTVLVSTHREYFEYYRANNDKVNDIKHSTDIYTNAILCLNNI